MKDIETAIQVEEKYIRYRLRGEEPYALVDKLAEFGFSTLDEYFAEKREYEIQQLDFEVIDTSSDMGAYVTAASVHLGDPTIVFGNTDSTSVFHGDEDFNEEYCTANGIAVINYLAEGGNIVISNGDLSLGLSFPIKDVTTGYILGKIRDILSKYEDNVEVDDNDILVAGKKVAGSASFQDDNALGMVIHFSFSDKSELITSICKEVRKPVGYITGITREQLREEVESWLLRL